MSGGGGVEGLGKGQRGGREPLLGGASSIGGGGVLHHKGGGWLWFG